MAFRQTPLFPQRETKKNLIQLTANLPLKPQATMTSHKANTTFLPVLQLAVSIALLLKQLKRKSLIQGSEDLKSRIFKRNGKPYLSRFCLLTQHEPPRI